MKNQYFGDKKDVFKFGVCLKLLKGLDLERFTWIAMLTPDDHQDFDWVDGNLMEFFGWKRDIGKMKSFFDIYCGDIEFCLIDREFKAEERDDYFRNIEEDRLKDALILVDPDTGLESKSIGRNSDQHLTFEELGGLYKKMNGKSILAVFQHRHRDKDLDSHIEYLRGKLNEEHYDKFLIIGKGDSIMILLFKDAELYKNAQNYLKEVLNNDVKMEIAQ